MQDVLISAGTGFAGGIIFGLVGYFKNRKQTEYFSGFEHKKFFVAVLGSGIIGAAASYTGVAPNEFASGMYGVLIMQALRKLARAIFK